MKTKNGNLFFMKRFILILGVLIIGLSLVACGGGSKKMKEEAPAAATPAEEVKGSLSRTFTIVDEQGRKSGMLTLDPLGGGVLLDENGRVIGTFKAEAPAPQPMDAPPEELSEPAVKK